MAEKRKYWLKISDEFLDLPEIEWITSKKDGSKYLHIYLKLCSKSLKNNGLLITKVNQTIIPFDSDYIYRLMHGLYSESVILAAIACRMEVGLIYNCTENNCLAIANIEQFIISESSSAERMRRLRERRASQCDKEVTQSDVTLLENSVTSASQSDIRDIDIKKKEYIYSLSFVNIQERNEEPAFIFPSLRGDVAIYQDWIDAEQDAYPNVDVLAEIKKARLWCLQDNGKYLKIKIGSFLNRWFAREQDKGPNRNLPAKSKPAKVYKNPDNRFNDVGEEVDL